MVFAKYLDEAVVPEWKRAYIDYRGLKESISAVHDAQAASAAPDVSPLPKPEPLPKRAHVFPTELSISWNSGPAPHTDKKAPSDCFSDTDLSRSLDLVHVHFNGPPGSQSKDPTLIARRPALDLKVQTALATTRTPSHHTPLTPSRFLAGTRRSGRGGLYGSGEAGPSYTLRTPTTPSRLANGILRAGTSLYRAASRASTPAPTLAPNLPLHILVESLPPSHQPFLRKLDSELDKVGNFYTFREREATALNVKLHQQIAAFSVHRDSYNAEKLCHGRRGGLGVVGQPSRIVSVLKSSVTRRNVMALDAAPVRSNLEAAHGRVLAVKAKDDCRVVLAQHLFNNPGDYKRAQKRLKRVLREHYRVLEALNNYRILNLMGFRKVLEKFDTTLRAPLQLQDAYMREKIESFSFAQGHSVQEMLRGVEEQFAACFFEGNSKAALADLRQRSFRTTHHPSVFVTGTLLGLSMPALASGLYQSFQPQVRAHIPGWDALLFIYGVFFVPVLLLLLLGTNLLVWARMRINYVFIFELNPQHVQDYKKYFELPALLLATLSYSCWMSFSWPSIGGLSPQTWPIAWLVFAIAIALNPLPVSSRSSRSWFARNVARLAQSGWHKVRFTEFWLSGQFASLTFTLSNVYFVACAYRVGFDHDPMATCSQNSAWGVPAILATLPSMIQVVQCMRRQVDTHKRRHLCNAAKFGVGVVSQWMYYWWRSEGAKRDTSFVLYCLAGTLYTVGSVAWEYIIDWSVLKPRARYPLLRNNFLYPLPVYYFALVSNVVIRFAWVCYTPMGGPSFALRSWLVAVAEVFRRWQWNFLRVESEHLGNMDSYRIMRELPLFYAPEETVQRT